MADLKLLSEKEKQLYDLIKESKVRVTNKVIVEKLSEKHIGALGKLCSKGLVEKTKTQKERDGYGKLIKYYQIKENKEK
jgi:DNA-binding PadR family transcriptional regulator